MTKAFDLREDVAGIPRATGTAPFTFNIKLAQEVKAMRAAADVDEELLADKEAELEAGSYTAHIESVTRERRQEIYEESLDKFVAKPDLMGRIDDKTQFLRGNFVRISVVSAAITKLVNPEGLEQDEDIEATVQFIHDKAPDQIFEAIERAIQKLNDEEDAQDELHKSADF